MSKYKINMIYTDGTEDIQDEIFDTEEEAREYAVYLVGCCELGAEVLNMSNPGDYLYDEDTYEDPEFEIIEVDE